MAGSKLSKDGTLRPNVGNDGKTGIGIAGTGGIVREIAGSKESKDGMLSPSVGNDGIAGIGIAGSAGKAKLRKEQKLK